MKYAPAPWTVAALRSSDELCVIDAHGGDVAEVFGGDGGRRIDNARLIAAAPTLLAAVHFARAAFSTRNPGDAEYITVLDDAIAKAKGEPDPTAIRGAGDEAPEGKATP